MAEAAVGSIGRESRCCANPGTTARISAPSKARSSSRNLILFPLAHSIGIPFDCWTKRQRGGRLQRRACDRATSLHLLSLEIVGWGTASFDRLWTGIQGRLKLLCSAKDLQSPIILRHGPQPWHQAWSV